MFRLRPSFQNLARRHPAGRSFSSKVALDKVLVANRGEIACRVLRTCQRLGIPTVALYSVADGPDALHARMADEAYLIGTGPSPTDSYLLQDQVLEIAQRAGATALHPGYGFLSENAGFVNKVEDASIRFIGPPASAIEAMGSKSKSKAIMKDANVPITPGFFGDENQDVEFLKHKAVTEVGFPLLIKAVMGGGGKGMRLVWNESEFEEALASCQRESQSAFGDSAVLLEKYLVRPRHVEVQVIADSLGNAVHLYERDCSLQRRHQKIIEEAPASDLPAPIRQELGAMGTRAAQAVGYVNAGTVEFLLDTNDPEKFYFCEMNTRLQVEHPITEQITGVDLVEWQLRIAAGEEIPMKQEDIPCMGHAFEARIYAENPARGFLPATGTIWHHSPPCEMNTGASNTGVRVDTGLQSGQEVGVYYDPMISKLIVHDQNRELALDKLVKSLKGYQIGGVPTNIEFLIKCANHPTFRQPGKCNTGFLEDFADDVHMDESTRPSPLAQSIGAFAAMLRLEKRIGTQQHQSSPWSSLSGSWRAGDRASRPLKLAGEDNDDGSLVKCISNRDGSFDIQVVTDAGVEEEFHISGSIDDHDNMQLVVNGTHRMTTTTILRESDGILSVGVWAKEPSQTEEFFWEIDFEHPLAPVSTGGSQGALGDKAVKSPMPGKVVRVNKDVGDSVEAGEVVMVLEAMKMNHSITSPRDGFMAEIRYNVDDIVSDGAVLFVMEEEENEALVG
ncbi:Methylcrotonoyl-CoA carboxylase subunit alpha, mitochondrial [Seminavis robusta]|uniref:Methylcrotonoyl-CoA carboxylase subunit alpha, mitochondrial n=1 Tax=Seminavis robusta TaxID=568900 RepID=A0A9N8DYJ7_9STRA|nr:Methylcrotonoyl-CoA carboxylase subunit alpha, mitochondrial [Seminavis robusta]|eukprot:Sro379_g130470.1 Methylcrotonoyl-CoA carboxylase subunit alpha, mitochondrial (732) ;mRNA; r:39857-42249